MVIQKHDAIVMRPERKFLKDGSILGVFQFLALFEASHLNAVSFRLFISQKKLMKERISTRKRTLKRVNNVIFQRIILRKMGITATGDGSKQE